MRFFHPASSRSQGQLHCKYAISLAGAAFTLAVVQQLLSGSMGADRQLDGEVSDSQLDAGQGSRLLTGGAGNDARTEPAAVIYAEDGSVLAVQQTANSTPVVVRGAIGGLPETEKKAASKAENNLERD